MPLTHHSKHVGALGTLDRDGLVSCEPRSSAGEQDNVLVKRVPMLEQNPDEQRQR